MYFVFCLMSVLCPDALSWTGGDSSASSARAPTSSSARFPNTRATSRSRSDSAIDAADVSAADVAAASAAAAGIAAAGVAAAEAASADVDAAGIDAADVAAAGVAAAGVDAAGIDAAGVTAISFLFHTDISAEIVAGIPSFDVYRKPVFTGSL